jgi:hypothetical protein
VLGDRGRAGEVRLDHLDEPGLVRGEAVSVEQTLEIGKEEAVLLRERLDAAVDRVQAPSQDDRRQPRQAELAPPVGCTYSILLQIDWIRSAAEFVHPTPSKTLIRLSMSYQAEGLVEALGSAAGLDERRVRGDLERLKELIETRGAESGAWRGEVSARSKE